MPFSTITRRMSVNRSATLLAAQMCAALVCTLPAVAQRSNRENSPYSRYGIGDLRGGTHVGLRGMGSASTAYANPFAINPDNPASYTALKFTTYEGAGEGSRRTVSAGGESASSGTATLSYLRVGIPLGKFGGMTLGLQPETRVYYRLQGDTLQLPGLGRNSSEYRGEGGTNYAFIGLAGKLKGFSAGVNFGYLFGSVASSASQVFYDADTAGTLNAFFSRNVRIGGVYAKGGVQYETKLSKKYMLRLGATGALQQDVTTRREQTTESIRRYLGVGSYRDTLEHIEPERGVIRLPLSYSGGIQLAREDKWTLNLDYRATRWSDYRSFEMRDSVTDNAYRIGLGGEYTPKATGRDYGSRITYRAGVSYGRDYVRLRGEDLPIFSATVGASLPFKRSSDRIHTALEIGRRGTETAGLARESFVRFSLGLSLVDKWFVKRRYE